MHTGLLIYNSLETLSGGYLYDRKLVEHLQANGDEVQIVSLPWRNYVLHLGDNLSASLIRRLESLPLDILLQDELNHPSLFWGNHILKKRVAYPIIAIVHHLRSSEAHPAWLNQLYRRVERRYLGSVDGFVFNSQTSRQVVEGLIGEGRPGVVAYPAGDRLRPCLTDDQLAARAREPAPLRLFFLGNLIPRKGLHTLLQAVASLPRPAWRLAVAGSLEMDRSYANNILRQVATNRLTEQVQFLGPLREADLVTRLQDSQVLVVPSTYEGFGIAYLEGMGFGLPAIASTGGAAKEIITPGVDGFLISPGDAPALAAYLLQLVEDRELLLKMSLAARRRYAAHPTWDETTSRIRAFLETIKSSQVLVS
jgi:glycosyltransferase involved in cell wall biosynthesis